MASELSKLIEDQLNVVDSKAGGARLKPVDVEVGPTAVAARSASRRRTAVACGVTIAAVVITALLLARHFAGPLGVPVGGAAKVRDEHGKIEAAKAASWNHVGPGPSETPAPTHAAAAHHDPTAVHHDATAATGEHAGHDTAPETHHEPAAAAEHTHHEPAATEHHATSHETPAAEHHTHANGETHAHEGGATPHTHDGDAAAAAAAHEHAADHTAAGHTHPATVTHGPGHDTDMPADADTP